MSRIGSWFASAVSSAVSLRCVFPLVETSFIRKHRLSCASSSPAVQALTLLLPRCNPWTLYTTSCVECQERTALRPEVWWAYLDISSETNVSPIICQQEAIKRLRRQAKDVFDQSRSTGASAIPPRHAELDDELDRLGGKTQLVNRRPRTPASSYRSSLSPDRMDEGWSTRPSMPSTAGWPGPQNKDATRPHYSRYSTTTGSSDFGGDGFYPPYGQGLDSTWDTFIEQLGF